MLAFEAGFGWEIVLITRSPVQKGGGFAEYALAPVTSTVKRPANVSAVEAASLPVAAMTALQSAIQLVGLKLDGSGPKLNILITAASGGVGLYWTQVCIVRTLFRHTLDN